MRTRQINKLWQLPLVLLALVLTGCDRDVDVEISLGIDDYYRDATVQIDFVRVSRSETMLWQQVLVSDYFSPGSRLRERAKKEGNILRTVYYQVPKKSFESVLFFDSKDKGKYGIEEGKEPDFDIFVLVDLPHTDPQTASRIGKFMIPMREKSWQHEFSQMNKLFSAAGFTTLKLSLQIRITPDGIILNPAPRF